MRVVAITSGAGGDFIALLKAQHAGILKDVQFQLLLSTISNSMALEEAKKVGIKSQLIDMKTCSRKELDNNLEKLLLNANPDLICLCGFKYLLKNEIISSFPRSIINSHPSLLPAFPGLVKKETMLSSKTKILGATVHVVDDGMDTGSPIVQAAFSNPGIENLPHALKLYRRVQDILYVQAVRSIVQTHYSGRAPKKWPERIIFQDGIMFVPPIDEDILRLF